MKKFRSFLFVLMGLVIMTLTISCQHSESKSVKADFLITVYDSLPIPALDGQARIVNADELFSYGIDNYFRKFNTPGLATPATTVQVYGLSQKATLQEIAASLGKNPDDLVMTQAQIIEICERYQDEVCGLSNVLFIIKKEGMHYVVRVATECSCGDLSVYVDPAPEFGLWQGCSLAVQL